MATFPMPAEMLVAQDEQVQAALRVLATPVGVRFREARFDTDHSGDPAIYVFFAVSKKIPLTSGRVRDLGDLRREAVRVVDELQTGRIPYVRFLDAR